MHIGLPSLSLAEYVFVSTSLALVIAKYFPGVHDQIVSRVTRLEHQSLYWGTAVVCNVFVYGLLLTVGRGFSICLATLYYSFWVVNRWSSMPIIALGIQEVVVFLILIFGATIALTRRDSVRDIPIPKQMAKVLINLSFCWSCFCCCVCCPKRCRAKTLRFCFVQLHEFCLSQHLDLISIVFTLFIEELRATILTVTLLYTSLLVFVVFLISLIIFHDRNHDVTCCKQLISCFSCACVLITAVTLMVIIYMTIVFSLKLQGFSGILTGLIPTIALSAASWYIKTKLLQRALRQTNQDRSRPGGSDKCINDREREEITDDDHKMLLP